MAKIAVIVCNPSALDYRVNKQAEFMASKGHHVRIYCRTKPGLPDREVVYGVEYIRINFSIVEAARQWLPFRRKNLDIKAVLRTEPDVVPVVAIATKPKGAGSVEIKTETKAIQETQKALSKNITISEDRSFAQRLANFLNLPLASKIKIPIIIWNKILKRVVGIPRKIFRKFVVRPSKKIFSICKRLYRKAFSIGVKLIDRSFRLVVNSFSKALIHKAFATIYRPHLEQWNPDIIHAHDLIALPAGVQAAKTTGAKVIYDAHELETHRNPPPPFLVQQAISWIEKRNIVDADAVITVCDPIAEFLGDRYKIDKPYVVMNTPEYPPTKKKKGLFLEDTPFDPPEEHWRYSAKQTGNLRELVGVPDGGIIAVYVGLVTVNRGIETVIEALPEVPEGTLVTVGPTNLKTVEKLKQMAIDNGVADRFVQLPPVPATQVIEFVASADFGVCPIWPITQSYNWALPNKLFEMTFAGLPIVASNTQEVSRFLRTNNIGQIYQYNDAAECADNIKKLLANFDDYRLSDEKIEQVRKAYSWQKQTEVVNEIYDQLLNS